MRESSPAITDGRERRRLDGVARIEAAILQALGSGDPFDLTYDRLADAAGVSRRTVYRYLPDRDALMRAAYELINRVAGPMVRMPDDEASLISGIPKIFAGFDKAEAVLIATMGTPQGRAVRNAMKAERVAAYRTALADATMNLPEPDKTKAIAAIQLLASGHAWIEMREQWDLDGPAAAEASLWAINTLLADLKARSGRPLNEGSAGDSARAD